MGHFASTLRRARADYAQRRQALLNALAPCLSTGSDISTEELGACVHGTDQGLHLCLRLPTTMDDQQVAQRIAGHGLTVRPLSAYCLQRQDLRGLVIGYGYAPLAQIEHWGTGAGQIGASALGQAPKRLCITLVPVPAAGHKRPHNASRKRYHSMPSARWACAARHRLGRPCAAKRQTRQSAQPDLLWPCATNCPAKPVRATPWPLKPQVMLCPRRPKSGGARFILISTNRPRRTQISAPASRSREHLLHALFITLRKLGGVNVV